MLWLNLILAIGTILLQYPLWWGDGSFRTIWERQEAIAIEQKTQGSLKARNRALEAEVKDLKGGLEALEERARQELGLIKPGETFYQWVNGDNHAKDPAQ